MKITKRNPKKRPVLTCTPLYGVGRKTGRGSAVFGDRRTKRCRTRAQCNRKALAGW